MRARSLFLLVTLLAACDTEDVGDSPPADFAPPSAADTVGVEARGLEAELPLVLASSLSPVAAAAGAPQVGTVRILRASDSDGAMTVTIELNEVRPGSHAWEIREGDCVASVDSDGSSTGSADMSGRVEVGDAGFGEASSMLPVGAIRAGDLGYGRYSLLVLEASRPTGGNGVIACADL